MHHALRLEVVEIVEVERVVLGRELGGSRLSPLDDLVDVVVDEEAAKAKRSATGASRRKTKQTHLFPEAIIFSAPCWIMSSRSSLFWAAGETEQEASRSASDPSLSFLHERLLTLGSLLSPTLLDNKLVESELLGGSLKNSFFDSVLREDKVKSAQVERFERARKHQLR